MGKKKKSKIKKGDISVVSKGFNSTTDDEREDLVNYFDKLVAASKNNNHEHVHDIMIDLENDENDNGISSSSLALEIEAFINDGADSDDFSEEKDDVSVDIDNAAAISSTETEHIQEPETFGYELVNSEVVSESDIENDEENKYVPFEVNPIIFEDDKELIHISSWMKNGNTIDLFSQVPSDENPKISDEDISTIMKHIRMLLIGMIHPAFLMDMETFENKFINEGAFCPDNVYVRTVHNGDGSQYIGMFAMDTNFLDETLDEIVEYTKETNVRWFTSIIKMIISTMAPIRFRNSDIDRYFTKKMKNTNIFTGEEFIDYCLENGSNVNSETDDGSLSNFEKFFTGMFEKGRLINDDFVQDSVNVIQNIFDNYIEDEIEYEDPDIESDDTEYVDDEPDEAYNENIDESEYDDEVNGESEDDIDIIDADEEGIGSSVMADALRNVAISDEDEPENLVFRPHYKKKG